MFVNGRSIGGTIKSVGRSSGSAMRHPFRTVARPARYVADSRAGHMGIRAGKYGALAAAGFGVGTVAIAHARDRHQGQSSYQGWY